MAYIANTMFSQRATNAAHDDLANIPGKFQASSQDEICSAGFLCVRSTQIPSEAYGSYDVLNENAWIMIAAATGSNSIYACNPYDVNEVQDPSNGNVYKVGHNTLGLPAPAGSIVSFTKVDFASNDKIYRFGAGNFSGSVGENKFFTVSNGLLTPGASAPETGVYFELVGSGTAIQGTYAGMGYYDLMAKTAA